MSNATELSNTTALPGILTGSSLIPDRIYTVTITAQHVEASRLLTFDFEGEPSLLTSHDAASLAVAQQTEGRWYIERDPDGQQYLRNLRNGARVGLPGMVSLFLSKFYEEPENAVTLVPLTFQFCPAGNDPLDFLDYASALEARAERARLREQLAGAIASGALGEALAAETLTTEAVAKSE